MGRPGTQEAPGTLVGVAEGAVLTVRHFWPDLPKWLDGLPDPRDQELITYDRRFLAWWGLGLFLFKLGSRRQLDFELREMQSHVLANLNRLAGTHQTSLPVDGTLDYFVEGIGPAPLACLRTSMMQRLIRMKVLDDARLEGHVVIAVDGTGWLVFGHRHCDRCIAQKQGDVTRYMHLIEEAKLIGPSGLALSIATEFIENQEGADSAALPKTEEAKQDCELKAIERMAPQLKRDFPQLRICLTGDSLYACGRSISIAESHGWSWIFTFKEGRTPALWREFQSLAAQSLENSIEVRLPNGTLQVYRWVNRMPYQDDAKRTWIVNAIECIETVGNSATRYAWLTALPVNSANVAVIAQKGGRSRFRIENEGFNIQKNSDFDLEHPYSTDLDKMKAYYLLLQVAHIIVQLLEKGSLLRHLAAKTGKSPLQLFGSLRNIGRRLLEAFRNCLIPDSVFDPHAATSIQIRLSPT